MQIFENEYVVAIDCDDTLVMWDVNHTQPHENSVAFICPYDGSTNHLIPNKKHIDFLKKCKGRGMCIMVWSAGGVLWAEAVINTLGLSDYVDLIITKPSKYVDDLFAKDILGQRVYLK